MAQALPQLLSGYTRVSGFPKFSRKDGQIQVTDKQYIALPNFSLRDLEDCDRISYQGLFGTASDAEPNPSGTQMLVTISYSRATSGNTSQATSARPEYELDDGGQEIAVDAVDGSGNYILSNYRTNWNHHLAGAPGASIPAWWATATTVISPDPLYRWTKEIDGIKDGEIILKSKTMAVETYTAPAPVVVEKRRYTSYSSAIRNVPRPGQTRTPGRTFGYSGQWLVVSAPMRPDGRRWEAVIRYQLSEKWDSRIYAAAPAPIVV